jgi:hypothetical protein
LPAPAGLELSGLKGRCGLPIHSRHPFGPYVVVMPENPAAYRRWAEELDGLLLAARAAAGPLPTETSAGTITALGGGRYQVGTHPPVTLEENEDNVFQALLEAPGNTLDKPALIRNSGVDDAPRVLGRLRRKHAGTFATAIQCPGARGRGGYRVNIVSTNAATRDGVPGVGEPGSKRQR